MCQCFLTARSRPTGGGSKRGRKSPEDARLLSRCFRLRAERRSSSEAIRSCSGRAAATVFGSAGAVPDFKSYIVPLPKGKMLPRIPPDGFHSEEEIAHLLGARKLDALGAPGPAIGVYAFERVTVQRNLYRIPVP